MAADRVRMKGDEDEVLKGGWDKLEFDILVIALKQFAEEQDSSLGDDEAIADRLAVNIVHLGELSWRGQARIGNEPKKPGGFGVIFKGLNPPCVVRHARADCTVEEGRDQSGAGSGRALRLIKNLYCFVTDRRQTPVGVFEEPARSASGDTAVQQSKVGRMGKLMTYIAVKLEARSVLEMRDPTHKRPLRRMELNTEGAIK